jgi:trimeric autotransporter adhesin
VKVTSCGGVTITTTNGKRVIGGGSVGMKSREELKHIASQGPASQRSSQELKNLLFQSNYGASSSIPNNSTTNSSTPNNTVSNNSTSNSAPNSSLQTMLRQDSDHSGQESEATTPITDAGLHSANSHHGLLNRSTSITSSGNGSSGNGSHNSANSNGNQLLNSNSEGGTQPNNNSEPNVHSPPSLHLGGGFSLSDHIAALAACTTPTTENNSNNTANRSATSSITPIEDLTPVVGLELNSVNDLLVGGNAAEKKTNSIALATTINSRKQIDKMLIEKTFAQAAQTATDGHTATATLSTAKKCNTQESKSTHGIDTAKDPNGSDRSKTANKFGRQPLSPNTIRAIARPLASTSTIKKVVAQGEQASETANKAGSESTARGTAIEKVRNNVRAEGGMEGGINEKPGDYNAETTSTNDEQEYGVARPQKKERIVRDMTVIRSTKCWKGAKREKCSITNLFKTIKQTIRIFRKSI